MAENGHLLFIWKTTGYELQDADGDAPENWTLATGEAASP